MLVGDIPVILVAGHSAGDVARQGGGQTIVWEGAGWQRHAGQDPTGGHSGTVAQNAMVWYDPAGKFDAVKGLDVGMAADVGIVVLADEPYAGGKGGRADLTLPPAGVAIVDRVRARRRALVVTFISSRQLIATDQLPRRETSVNATGY